MTDRRLAVAIVLASSLAWPARGEQKLETPESIALASGVRVRLLDVRMYAQGELQSAVPTLFVDYLTARPIRDRCALRTEVRQVWQHFKKAAEEQAAHRVFIVPNDAPVGGSSTSFALRRTDGTEWTERGGFAGCGGAKKGTPPKPRQ